MSEFTVKESNKEAFNWILNVTYGVSFAAVGFIISLVFASIDRIDKKLDRVPVDYIQKIDYRDDQLKIYQELKDISRKSDTNADSIKADYNRRMDKIEEILNDQLKTRP